MTTTLARTIHRLRVARGLSQWQLATAIGVTHRAVGHWEQAKRSPRGLELYRMARALGTTVEELVEGRAK